jgi:hypothetical protein
MNPSEIVRALEAEGLTLTASGDAVVVQPRARLTDATRALIRDNKAEILCALRATASPGAPFDSGDLRAPVARVGLMWDLTPAEVEEAPALPLAKPEEPRKYFEALAAVFATRPADPSDDRITCKACALRRHDGVCRAATRREIPAARNYTPAPDLLRRCEGFIPRAGDPDRRSGAQRWPRLAPRVQET